MKHFLVLLFSIWTTLVDAGQGPANPISRVVSLLTNLREKLEKDFKAEEDLYETYKCWAFSTVESKKASNAAAEARIADLKSYIADIDAGKIEFTTERVDLDLQIKNLKEDLQVAKINRDKEQEDFKAAEKEMEMAIAALEEAIKTIEEGTKGSLVQTHTYIGLLSKQHSTQKVLSLTRQVLDGGDQFYLQRLLAGDVPEADWKKLNRKATFKMKYNKRSGKILETLNDLLETFETNLKNARDEEKAAQAAYEKLKESKEDMLSSSQKARQDMVLEGAARGQSRDEAQAEVDALQKQIDADTKFIKQTEDVAVIKAKEWGARKEVRQTEIVAIGKALSVLASDDAKDLFKESFESQGYMLIQKAHTSSLAESQHRLKQVARLVSSLASESGDKQLLQLASMAGNEAINKVIEKIDEIVAAKKENEAEDLKNKEKCEKDLADTAAKARKAAVEMDDATDEIVRATTKIEQLKGLKKEQEAKKLAIEKQLGEIKVQRDRENEDYKADKITDQKAVKLVEEAIVIMKDWKNAKAAALISQRKMQKMTLAASALREVVQTKAGARLSLLQIHAASDQNPEYVVPAGQAPLPPPSTWGAGAEYTGATGEHEGIVGILEMVKEDIEKDIQTADDAEAEALKAYEKLKADLEDEHEATEEAIEQYKKDIADKEQVVEDQKTARLDSKANLDAAVEMYNSFKPGCDFLLINFDVRTTARHTEIDGLLKAKAILQGADFGESLL